MRGVGGMRSRIARLAALRLGVSAPGHPVRQLRAKTVTTLEMQSENSTSKSLETEPVSHVQTVDGKYFASAPRTGAQRMSSGFHDCTTILPKPNFPTPTPPHSMLCLSPVDGLAKFFRSTRRHNRCNCTATIPANIEFGVQGGSSVVPKSCFGHLGFACEIFSVNSR